MGGGKKGEWSLGLVKEKKSLHLFLLRHLKVKQKKKNLTFFSPLSLSTHTTHTKPGARGVATGCVVVFCFCFCFLFLFFAAAAQRATTTTNNNNKNNTIHNKHTNITPHTHSLLCFVTIIKQRQGKEGCQKCIVQCAKRTNEQKPTFAKREREIYR